MQLIDKKALNMHLADIQLANRGWKDDFCDILDDIMQMVDDMPTVDAVPGVYCKDCVEYEPGKIKFIRSGEFDGLCGFFGRPVLEDDFCSCSERRGEG